MLLATVSLPAIAMAQMDHAAAMGGMKREALISSSKLTITGLHGETKALDSSDLAAMPHETVTVTNGHTHQQETYSGVPVKDLLALVEANAAGMDTMERRRAGRLLVIFAEGTDNYRIVLTACDTDPGCRSGKAIVADSLNSKPLTTDGVFKLILTEDKTPSRWVRNLKGLTVKNLGPM